MLSSSCAVQATSSARSSTSSGGNFVEISKRPGHSCVTTHYVVRGEGWISAPLPHLWWGILREGPACEDQIPHVPLGRTKLPSKCSGPRQTPVLVEAVWGRGAVPQ